MEKFSNFNLRFITRKSLRKGDDRERLSVRITVDKLRAEVSLGKNISKGLFNHEMQLCSNRSKEGKQVNEFISIISSNLNEIRKQLILEEKEVTPELIKARFKGEPDPDEVPKPMLLEYYEEHNQKFKELIGTKDHSPATHKRHITSKGHVRKFIEKVYHMNDLPLEKLNHKFLKDYEHYLKADRKCNHNSAMKYIKNLGKIINQAYAEGHLGKNPLNNFKITYEPVERVALTQKEVDAMVELEIPEARLDRVRDMFIFCVYTGIAFADMIDLRMHHIYEDNEGTKWIKNKRLKSHIEFVVPILPITQNIIDKYANTPQRTEKGLVIPSISNQNYNGYLKELAIRCKIDKNLTSHIARHTFATTIAIENGVPLEVLSKMLGHSETKTTQIYAKMHEKAIKLGMKSLFENDKNNSKKQKNRESADT